MRLITTTHAIERWRELADFSITFAAANIELTNAAANRPERVGHTRKGQTVLRVTEPRRAYLVVKMGPDKLARAYSNGTAAGIIVTVLPPELWERDPDRDLEADDLDAELERDLLDMYAREAAGNTSTPTSDPPLRPAPPKPWSLPRVTDPRWEDWAWVVAGIERERRIALHMQHDLACVAEMRAVCTAADRLLHDKGDCSALADALAELRRVQSGRP